MSPLLPTFAWLTKEGEDRLAFQLASGLQHRVPLPLPCSQCSTVIYCSETCRTEAWNTYLPILALSAISSWPSPKLTPVAQRMLYSAGSCQNIKGVMRDWKSTTDKCSLITGQADSLIWPPNPYSLLRNLRLTRLPAVCNAKQEGNLFDSDGLLSRQISPDHWLRACKYRKGTCSCASASCFPFLHAFRFFPLLSARDEEMFAARILLRHWLQLKANYRMPAKGDHHHQVSVHGIAGLLSPTQVSRADQ